MQMNFFSYAGWTSVYQFSFLKPNILSFHRKTERILNCTTICSNTKKGVFGNVASKISTTAVWPCFSVLSIASLLPLLFLFEAHLFGLCSFGSMILVQKIPLHSLYNWRLCHCNLSKDKLLVKMWLPIFWHLPRSWNGFPSIHFQRYFHPSFIQNIRNRCKFNIFHIIEIKIQSCTSLIRLCSPNKCFIDAVSLTISW